MPVVSLNRPCAGTHPHVYERGVGENGGEGAGGGGVMRVLENSSSAPIWNPSYSIESRGGNLRAVVAEIRRRQEKCCLQSGSFNPSAGGKS